jgi:hypothetical protein
MSGGVLESRASEGHGTLISAATGFCSSSPAKQLQIAGTVSPVAKAALEQHGWKIHDRQEGRLID